MRRLVFSFLYILISISCFAQSEIRGKVVDNKQHKPVVSATVTVHPIGSSKYLTYSVTDENGEFVLKMSAFPDSVEIAVRSMISKPYRKRIRANIGYLEISVEEKVTELKEVIIKAPKIRQMGDTINYSVSEFIDPTDKSIGDVLKKLPGVQVLSSGQILYQNKAISKFYIEGLDMLKGKYGIATKNIDADKVAAVQVLENHQPIKVLKDMEMPKETAINLKLKESAKGAFFATAKVGLGLPLWLYNNELVGMRFTRKQQNMLVLKNDNTGRDISQELNSFYDQAKNLSIDFLSVSSPSSPNIQEQHYLFNQANLVSLNNLLVLSKDATLTGNLNFLHDKQTQKAYSEQQIFLADGQKVFIVEDAQNRLLKKELEGALVWEANKNNQYLHNKLKAISKWNSERGILLPASHSQNDQDLNTPSLNISDDFKYIFKRGKRQYQLGGFIGYVNQKSRLTVSPSPIGELFIDKMQKNTVMRQDVNYNHLASNAYFSGAHGEDFNISYKLQTYTNLYRLNTAMYNSFDQRNMFMADSLQNQLSRNEFGTAISTNIYWKFSSGVSTSLSLPLDFFYVKKADAKHLLEKSQFYTFFSPVLHFNLGVTPRTQMTISSGYRQNIGDITEDYVGYVMSGYRRINRSGIMQSQNREAYSRLWLVYRNPFTTLFASMLMDYSHRWKNILRNFRYDGIFSSEEGIYYPNSSNTFLSSFSIERSIEVLRSSVKLSVGYDYKDGMTLNQEEISKFRTNSWQISPSITTNVTRWLIGKYRARYIQSVHAIEEQHLPTIHSFRQDITFSILPIKKLILNTSFNHYYNSLLSAETKSIWFGNIGAQYKMNDMDIMLDWTNIFNTRYFTTSSYSNTFSYYSRYKLRPSELLLRVKLKLF